MKRVDHRGIKVDTIFPMQEFTVKFWEWSKKKHHKKVKLPNAWLHREWICHEEIEMARVSKMGEASNTVDALLRETKAHHYRILEDFLRLM